VHISALADKYVKDPHSVVKAGDIVKVKVVEVDEKRKRIALTMRLQDAGKSSATPQNSAARPAKLKQPERAQEPQGAMASAFANLNKRVKA